MFQKLISSSCALLISFMLFGMSTGHAQNQISDSQKASSQVTHIAQNGNDDNDDDTDWGWIGLIGLAGLLGLRRNDKKA